MGKFKNIYIDKLNNGEIINLDNTNNNLFDYSKLKNEKINLFINGRNLTIPLISYMKKSSKRIFLFTPLHGKVHLWDWSNFRDEVQGKLLYFETNHSLILSQIIEIDKSIVPTKELLTKYNLQITKRFK